MATSVPPNSDSLHRYVEELQLYASKIGENLTWETSQSGPPHNIIFTYNAQIGDEIFPKADGKTKKEARYNAAKSAVGTLKHRNANHDASPESNSRTPSPAGMANYISKLNEAGQKKGTLPDYRVTTIDTGVDHVQKFSCKVIIDQKEYPTGFGGSKQIAKREAAKLAYEEIHKIQSPSELSRDLRDEDEPKNIDEDSPGHNLKRLVGDHSGETEKSEECAATASMDGCSSDSDSRMQHLNNVMKNAIGVLHEYCQKNSLSCSLVDVNKRGPSHDPEFTQRYVINKRDFPCASGRSKQEAKQKAARLAMEQLQLMTASGMSWSSQSEYSSVSQDGDLLKRNSELSDGSNFIIFEHSAGEHSTPKSRTTGGSRSKRRLAPNFTSLDTKSDSTSFQTDGNSTQDKSLDLKIEGWSDIKIIGEGGYGRVYKAKNELDKVYYAVKEVPIRNEKTLREVENLAQMDHHNIVRYFFAKILPSTRPNRWSKESLFIQMRLYEKDLSNWIEDRENNKPAQEAVAMDIFCQLLDGVAYIHQQKMMHRDLKPDNIFLDKGTIVKIGDFGLATTLEDKKALTRDVGTPVFMSPEQVRGEGYDHKVDIFALGLIFFRLLWIRHGTVTERSEKWPEIRKGNFPAPFDEKCRSESLLIRKMLSETASARPEADEIQQRLKSGEQDSKTI
uniref:interferon-induced, double-stranded RNA-activated protein kinase n=1 Tax=Pristiophorus japonicus TaxID=55135 RepID=UPI00398EDE03